MDEQRFIRVSNAKSILKQYGYAVDNLWSAEDINEDLPESVKRDLVSSAVADECVVSDIFSLIDAKVTEYYESIINTN